MNGRVTFDAPVISSLDRGLQYGDGFFTTIHVQQGRLLLWSLHLARLKLCQQRLAFPELDWSTLEKACHEKVVDQTQAVLKILVTRGDGGRGYMPPEQTNPRIQLYLSQYPQQYALYQQQGVHLSVSDIPLGHQPYLAGLKTLNRLEQVLIKQQASSLVGDDVLVLDIDGAVIETSMANLIAVQSGRYYTPDLQRCGIQGVYLSALQSRYQIDARVFSYAELLDMDAVFICNSLLGCVPVRQIENRYFDSALGKRYQAKLQVIDQC